MAGSRASARLSSLCRHLTRAPTAAASGSKPKVGIVGLGGRGSSTLGTIEGSERLQEKMTVVALADVDAEALEPHKGKGYTLFATASELIQSGLIDTLLIVTPHYYHTTIGAEAFAAGLHVLTEKPISVHKADCEKLIAAYDARPNKEQKFAAMFNNRQRSPTPVLAASSLSPSHRMWVARVQATTLRIRRCGRWWRTVNLARSSVSTGSSRRGCAPTPTTSAPPPSESPAWQGPPT